MIRTATEYDLAFVRALIKSIPGLWHAEWRSDALERAIRASDGLSFVWEETGYILGFSCATLISDVWQDAVGFYQALGWSAPGAVSLRHRLTRSLASS
jgi:hypothetical protein